MAGSLRATRSGGRGCPGPPPVRGHLQSGQPGAAAPGASPGARRHAAVAFLSEVLVPGVLFMWLGAAAIVTGLILLGIPDLGWQLQLVVFAVLSVVSARKLSSPPREKVLIPCP